MDPAVRRTVRLLTLSAFASSASMRMCDPLLPRLASDFDVGLSSAAGAITGFAVSYGLLQLVIGPLSDRWGKFRLVMLAMAAAALASIASALAPSMPALVAARVLAGGVSGAIIPVALAWIGDEVPFSERQGVLAGVMSGGLLGLISGQLLSGVLADTLGWRWAFAGVGLLFAALAWRMALSPAARVPLRGGGTSQVEGGLAAWVRAYGQLMRPLWVRLVLACAFTEGVLMYGALSFVPSALHTRFDLPLWQAAMASAVIGVGGFTYTLLARGLIRRLGERRLVLLGGSLVAAGLLAIGLAPQAAVAVGGALALGWGFYAFHNTVQVHGTQLSQAQRGMGMALFALCFFSGQSFGVALAAQVVDLAGFAATFCIAGLAFGALALGFQRAIRRHGAAHAAGVAQTPR